ncbi:MAG: universal stress protein [Flavobacteriales bacterium]|nr:universal stress protein [Bacteroidota bacterium]MCB9241987.1 universal stress protein [Flavobacteriales bacterium]
MDFKIQNILVGFDYSLSAQIALKKAAQTAKRLEAKLHAAYIGTQNASIPDEIKKFITETSTEFGLDIEFIERHGKVYKEISILEREIGADLIIVGTHGSEGWQPFWIGSNAFRIVAASNCPVITIQETTKDTSLTDILLPLDDSETTRQKVPYAAIIAQAFNAKVHVLSVSKGKGPVLKNRLKRYGKQTVEYMAERGIDTTFKAMFGVKPPKAILDYSKELRAGLIIMMTDTESLSVVMGSYAQEIINNSVVPVMSIHSRDLAIAGSVGY